MIDKNYRLFGKVSIVDILLVVIIIAFVFLAINFSAPQSVSAKTGDTQVKYTVELFKLEPTYLDKIQVGDTLYDNLKNTEIGKITKIYSEPYLEIVPDKGNSIYRKSTVEGYIYVYLEVEASAKLTDYQTLIGQYEIQVGKDVYVRTKNIARAGYVVKIERIEQN